MGLQQGSKQHSCFPREWESTADFGICEHPQSQELSVVKCSVAASSGKISNNYLDKMIKFQSKYPPVFHCEVSSNALVSTSGSSRGSRSTQTLYSRRSAAMRVNSNMLIMCSKNLHSN